MKKILYLFLCVSWSLFSQTNNNSDKAKADENIVTTETKNIIREGNKQYNQGNYKNAEKLYAQSVKQNATYDKSNYNLGNAYFQQKKFKEAKAQYELASKTSDNKFIKADAYHNIGNIEMQDKKYGPAVEAYKNAMRNNPNDDETRYNLALAQKLLKKQQNKDKNKNKDKDKKDNKDKNKDNKKDKKDNKDKNKDDKNKKNKDKKDNKDKNKDKKEDKGKNDKNKDGKGDKDKKENQKPKPQPSKLSPNQVKQLLKAMNNEENKTQQKMNARKERGKKVKQEKDW